jgi:hypothetical protein
MYMAFANTIKPCGSEPARDGGGTFNIRMTDIP